MTHDPIIVELDALLLDWTTGELERDGVERIQQILRSSTAARKHFARMQTLDAALNLDGSSGLVPIEAGEFVAEESRVRPHSRRVDRTSKTRWARVGLAIAATLLLCVMAGRLAYLEFQPISEFARRVAVSNPDQRDRADEATSSGIAMITQLVDVQWAADQQPFEVGDAVGPGRLAIDSGYAQVEFFCGATVVVEGPADLELESAMLARVRQGRLRAQVPPAARGFALEMNDLKVVDLGTEFGLSVSADGTDVQVFDGEVELHRPAAEPQTLTTGQAVVRRPAGGYEQSAVTPDSFVDLQSLGSRAAGQDQRRYQRWKAWSEDLRADPRLIAYYAFDETGGWQRRLSSSLEPANNELDGAIVGARTVVGRWDAKQALEFKQPGDRVRVEIPGEYDSLTFTAWVKIDSLDRWYNSLFLTDNYNQGEPHWQILDTGQLFFSVRVKSDDGRGPEHREVLSPTFWDPSLSGKWLHLATVYDVPNKRVTHYLDGEVLSHETIPDFQLVKVTRFGRATIGNWSFPQRPDADFAIRNLNGSMDEFALFADALSDEEIRDIYRHGRP